MLPFHNIPGLRLGPPVCASVTDARVATFRERMDTTTKKPDWELAIRRQLGLPRHFTANDGASVILRVGIIFAIAAVILLLSAPWYLSYAALFAAVDFAGLGLQQYSFYTSRVYSECWVDEGSPVVALVALTACLFGGVSLLLYVLLANSTLSCLLLLGTLHGGILSSYRWQFWGSFFDGNDKLHDANARRNY